MSAKKNAAGQESAGAPEQEAAESRDSHGQQSAAAAPERSPLIAGNWKMNLDHLQSIAMVQKLSWSLKDVKHDYGDVEVAVFPPFTDLRSVQTLLAADKLSLKLGAQDVSPHEPGAFTGEIAATFLGKLDVSYVLVGHSERRVLHSEDDALISAKALAAVRAGLVPIICVGENAEERAEHGSATIAGEQLSAVLAGLPESAPFVVAYEPVWAIGSGDPASPDEAEGVAAQLRQRIQDLRGAESAGATRILYGGSVTSQNIAGFMNQPNIDGALVGGASIDADEFSRIAQFRKHVTAG